MSNLRELAEYYYKKKIYVFPAEYVFKWEDWRNRKQELSEVNDLIWEDFSAIRGVAGCKGIRVVKFMNIADLDIDKIYSIIKAALVVLHLRPTYRWIITTSESISIIVESPDDIQGMRNLSFQGREDLGIGNTVLLWQADFILPSFDSRVRFLAGFPSEIPAHVTNDCIFKCIDTFRDSDVLKVSSEVKTALKL